MKPRFYLLFLILVGWTLALQGQSQRHIAQVIVDGPIGPATSDFFERALTDSAEAGAEILVLQMDTPGGLDSAMRDIIRDILAAPIPVVTYVAPSGARAASAGTYISYAAHVAAMAPGTNLGAATPVQIGGGTPRPGPGSLPEPDPPADSGESGEPGKEKSDGGGDPKSASKRKQINDAVAYIRSLAQLRNRNEQWAEAAVRGAESLPAEEALEKNVIDIVAGDLGDLLKQLDGREISISGQTRTLATAGLPVRTIEMDWRAKLLATITNPNVAYVLMLLGIYGLFFELANPGAVVPGVLGAISLLLALYAFQLLPVNYTGLALILLGIVFMVAEVFAPSFGALGIGGVVAFVFGSIILVESGQEGYEISLATIGGLALVSAGIFIGLGSRFAQVRARPAATGSEELINSIGEAIEDFEGRGHIHIHGENWQARSRTPIKAGESVRVTGIRGLVLDVEPAQEQQDD